MKLKNSKSRFNALLILSMLIWIFLAFQNIDRTLLLHDINEAIMSSEPGFSSPRNLVDQGGFTERQSAVSKASSIAVNATSIARHILSSKNNNINEIYLTVKFEDLLKINQDRLSAIKQGFLTEPTEVKASVEFQGEKYRAKVRLKGDLPDHWMSKYRFSLRVELKDKKTIFGMNSFSIQKPRSRQHPYEQAFQGALNRLGNLSSNQTYARVYLNSKQWGIMNVEEHLSAEYLEKVKRKDSPIFRLSDDFSGKTIEKRHLKKKIY